MIEHTHTAGPVLAFSYNPRVDRHIYGIKGGCESSQDWRDLAIAAMDQAGCPVSQQEEIRELLAL